MRWILIALLILPSLPIPRKHPRKYRQPSGRADMLMVKVVRKAPVVNRTLVFAWRYPSNSIGYTWSLELTTNFVNWITVTNYPYGYTNDVWVTNNYNLNTMFAYRMHGHL